MKSRTLYQCEVCGTEFESKEFAAFCESSSLPPCPVKPGDAVEAYERYGKPSPDVVVSARVGPGWFTDEFESMRRGDADLVAAWHKFFPGRSTHTWLVKMKNHHQYGKDSDAFTDEYEWRSVRLPGAKVRLDGEEWPS